MHRNSCRLRRAACQCRTARCNPHGVAGSICHTTPSSRLSRRRVTLTSTRSASIAACCSLPNLHWPNTSLDHHAHRRVRRGSNAGIQLTHPLPSTPLAPLTHSVHSHSAHSHSAHSHSLALHSLTLLFHTALAHFTLSRSAHRHCTRSLHSDVEIRRRVGGGG